MILLTSLSLHIRKKVLNSLVKGSIEVELGSTLLMDWAFEGLGHVDASFGLMHMNNDSYIIQVHEDVYEKKLSSNHTTYAAVVVTFDCL